MDLEFQHFIVYHDCKPSCSRLDRFLHCFEHNLFYESPSHCEAACIFGINVASVVLLLFQEYRSTVLVRQSSTPHQNTIWIISGLLPIARFFARILAQSFSVAVHLLNFLQ